MRGALRVLVVEDDAGVADAVRALLEQAEYDVAVAASAREACRRLDDTDAPLDACVLDVVLPDGSGFDVLKEIRSAHLLPVLMLTARGESEDKVRGLDAGADDYLVKPFDPPELLARLRALLRRSGKLQQQVLHIGDCTLDTVTHTLRRGQMRAELTAREERLLETLASVPGKVWTRSQLLSSVWADDLEIGDRTVDSAIKRLRRKIESVSGAGSDDASAGAAAGESLRIRSLYGLGYRVDGIRW